MYDMKALYEAESVEHAVALLVEHPEAQIIAGGSEVLVQMREGKRMFYTLCLIKRFHIIHSLSLLKSFLLPSSAGRDYVD